MITPQKFSEMLRTHPTEVRALLHKYHIFAPANMQTIQNAAITYGNRFTLELAQILATPTSIQQLRRLAGSSVTTPPPASGGSAPAGGSGSSGGDNFWSSFSSLLDYAYKVYDDKNNQTGGSQTGAPVQPAATTIAGIDTKTMLLVGGALVVIIIVILILKK